MQYYKKSQTGFSIVEALVGAVLMVIVFTVLGSFLMRFGKSASQQNERARQTQDSHFGADLLQADLERTGANLALSPKQKLTGEIALPFAPNEDFTVETDLIRRVGERTGTPLLSSVLWNGKGELRWRSDRFTITIGSLLGETRSIIADERTVYVLKNGEEVAQIGKAASYANYSFALSAISVDGGEMCRYRFSADNRLIYESIELCPLNASEISASLPYEAQIESFRLNAAEIFLRDDGGGELPVRLPLLPFYADQRMSLPLIETRNGFLFISGDESAEVMFLGRDYSFSEEKTDYLIVNNAESLQPDDVLLVCDYLNKRSVLLKVIELEQTYAYVVPITRPEGSGNFEKIYTPSEDFSGYIFTRGTRVVKLSAPIEYAIVAEDGSNVLYRRRGATAWELVLPNISDWEFSTETRAAQISFALKFSIIGEDIENSQSAPEPVRLSVSPRSLNRLYDTK